MMKKFALISLLTVALAACGTTYNAPTGTKLSGNIEAVAAYTIVSVISQNDFTIPKQSQNIIQLGTFKVNDNVYDLHGNKVLIPRDAIISGLYSNDGVSCMVEWKAVYIDLDEYNRENGSLTLRDLTIASVCDPLRGIKKGDRVTLSFRPSIRE